MKDYKPTYIDPTPQPIEPILGVSKELTEKGIYARHSVKTQVVNATGDYHITTGFPPRMIEVQVRETNEMCTGKTDFTTTYSIRLFSSGVDQTITTSASANLINMANLVGNATTRHEDGVTINISTYSWSAKTLYITSYS